MATFSQGEVVKVPFPYTDRLTRQSRPALVVSLPGLEDAHGLMWVVMITALSRAGIPAPSVIRPAKIATIEASVATKLGTISAAMVQQVLDRVGRTLGVTR
jgi:mRNA interferase MazF